MKLKILAALALAGLMLLLSSCGSSQVEWDIGIPTNISSSMEPAP